MNFRKDFDLSVYLVADPSVCGGRAVEDIVALAVRGGVTMVQLRNKIDPLDVVEEQARAVQDVLKGTGVPFILNDHVELAAKINADGVHIGQEDMGALHARAMIGDNKILGLTAFSRAHYDGVDPRIIDYVGTGPFFATQTKPDKPVLGAEGFAEIIKYAPVPVVGIGGITPENAGQVIRCGARGVAMMRSVSAAQDVEGAACQFVKIIRETRHVHS